MSLLKAGQKQTAISDVVLGSYKTVSSYIVICREINYFFCGLQPSIRENMKED